MGVKFTRGRDREGVEYNIEYKVGTKDWTLGQSKAKGQKEEKETEKDCIAWTPSWLHGTF